MSTGMNWSGSLCWEQVVFIHTGRHLHGNAQDGLDVSQALSDFFQGADESRLHFRIIWVAF